MDCFVLFDLSLSLSLSTLFFPLMFNFLSESGLMLDYYYVYIVYIQFLPFSVGVVKASYMIHSFIYCLGLMICALMQGMQSLIPKFFSFQHTVSIYAILRRS
jgi:hypothetical protein